MKIALTFDVEKDLNLNTFQGIEIGLKKLLLILDKNNIKATFFIPAKLIEKFPNFFKKLDKQNHEIALHGYEHERFDDLTLNEKLSKIKKSLHIYKKILNKNPKGFRAPQHSINNETLEILKQNNFVYDASYTPFNLLQLLFFPSKFKIWIRGFFTSRKVYSIKQDFKEIPTSSFLIPFVSLPFRVFPWPILKLYLILLKSFNKELVFYAHSWDLIKLPNSRIDKTFNHKKLLINLEKTINYFKYKSSEFLKMEQLI